MLTWSEYITITLGILVINPLSETWTSRQKGHTSHPLEIQCPIESLFFMGMHWNFSRCGRTGKAYLETCELIHSV